jgi:SAM-dependent methyltransferase
MAGKWYWNPNTLVLPQGGGTLRLFQVSYRRNVLTTLPALALIDLLANGAPEEEIRALHGQLGAALKFADATTFTLWKGGFQNPDFFDETITAADLSVLSWEDVRELLAETGMISDCWPPVFEYRKRSFGDRFRGTLYEQIATEALFHRTTPAAWWKDQKFTEDFTQIRPTPYRYIEERFLEAYFRERFGGAEVLEIGCGTGYFTSKMAAHARRAVGVDYNPDYLDIARRTWPAAKHPNLDFQVGDIIDLTRGTPAFARQQFDFVVLIDTFLFLFDAKYQPHLYEHRGAILENLRGLLRPEGLLLVMDPHPLWLTPWLGNPASPFGILTEYRDRHFKVIPSLEEMTSLLYDHGFRVRRALEPRIDEECRSFDPRRFQFMANVPQWWFFEIEPGAVCQAAARSA